MCGFSLPIAFYHGNQIRFLSNLFRQALKSMSFEDTFWVLHCHCSTNRKLDVSHILYDNAKSSITCQDPLHVLLNVWKISSVKMMCICIPTACQSEFHLRVLWYQAVILGR
jgi:hypothetical protein